MKKEDYPAYSDLVVSGSFQRGVETAEGGWFIKSFHVHLKNFLNCLNILKKKISSEFYY
jgi:hypothetical protein